MKHLNIMGIRGVPNGHGGYEYFTQTLAPRLIRRGWRVTVYCQDDVGEDGLVDDWNGATRIHIVPRLKGRWGTLEFDARCAWDVLQRPGVDLVLGYNGALFNTVQRVAGRRVAMGMDGVEWKRRKWPLHGKAWFAAMEWVAGRVAHVPIADHPEIARHLGRHISEKRLQVIGYGAEPILTAPVEPLAAFGVEPGRYLVNICRTEPENMILEIVRAFSRRRRGVKLVMVGPFDRAHAFHRACLDAASDEVIFTGPVFAHERVHPLRFHALGYFHGHTVGGTNPSLCEALGCGNAVIAHDNRFNRWVAGPEQFYFADEDGIDAALDALMTDKPRAERARAAARARHAEAFGWDTIIEQYDAVLTRLHDEATMPRRRAFGLLPARVIGTGV